MTESEPRKPVRTTGPSPLVTAIVECVFPRDRRDIVGDLVERLQQTPNDHPSRRFVAEASRVVPGVLWSAARRIGWGLLAVEAFAFWAISVSSAFITLKGATSGFLFDQYGFVRVTLSALLGWTALVLADIYRVRFRVPAALAILLMSNAGAALTVSGWALPWNTLAWSGFMILASLPLTRWFAGGPFRRPASPAPLAAERIRSDAAVLANELRMRMVVGCAVTLPLAALFGWFGWRAYHGHNLTAAAGAAVMVAGLLYLGYRVIANRPQPMPPGMSPAGVMFFYERELERQRDFHRAKPTMMRLAWVPGYFLWLVGFVLRDPSALVPVLICGTLFVGGLLLIVPLHATVARCYEQRAAALRGGAPPLRP